MDFEKYNLFIFDLDNTLYLHKVNYFNKKLYNFKLKKFLKELKNKNKKLAIASFNLYPYDYLDELDILDLFDIVLGDYPSKKSSMVIHILKNTNCSIEETIFFDDLEFNIKDVSALGIKCIHVDENLGLPI